MLIIGAGGFAKDLELTISDKNLVFFDNKNRPQLFVGKYRSLISFEEVVTYFGTNSNQFTLGIGNPKIRAELATTIRKLGGELVGTMDESARIGDTSTLGAGINILANVIISHNCRIGEGCILYHNVVISHDCQIGDYVEISPSATLLGKVEIGNFTQIGANATILPGIRIGDNVQVGAGAVVTKDVPSNKVVKGIPAK